MRSRYSAYAVGAVDYIMATTEPDGPMDREDRDIWAEEIRLFSAHTRFEKLDVQEVSQIDDDHGEVLFHATLSRKGEDVSFTERSRFVRRDGRWLYVAGEVQATGPIA